MEVKFELFIWKDIKMLIQSFKPLKSNQTVINQFLIVSALAHISCSVRKKTLKKPLTELWATFQFGFDVTVWARQFHIRRETVTEI